MTKIYSPTKLTFMKLEISVIVAMGEDREIGKEGKLLWHIPEDLKRFRSITIGHPVIMGRKTFESIGKALPGRTNVIVTRDIAFPAEGCLVAHSMKEAIGLSSRVKGSNEVFVIGGGQIYEQALPLADKLYLTLVAEKHPDADTFFPAYPDFKKVVFEESKEYGRLKYRFMELERETLSKDR